MKGGEDVGVLKSKRKASDFQVFTHFYYMRKEITDLLLRDFGFSTEKAEKKVLKSFGGKSKEELTEEEENQYIGQIAKISAFDEWFVLYEREAIMDDLRSLGMYLFAANDIYPQYPAELEQRRLCQDRALGCCESLQQELQYAIEVLPVDINKYTRFADMLNEQVQLIKGWRRSDNKFKKIVTKID